MITVKLLLNYDEIPPLPNLMSNRVYQKTLFFFSNTELSYCSHATFRSPTMYIKIFTKSYNFSYFKKKVNIGLNICRLKFCVAVYIFQLQK